MPGYVREPQQYHLVFTDEDMRGLEIHIGAVNLGEFMHLQELGDNALIGDDVAMVELFTAFCEALISWNLENADGTPVPPTIDGLKTMDVNFVLRLVREWMTAIASPRSPAPVPPPPPMPQVPLSPDR